MSKMREALSNQFIIQPNFNPFIQPMQRNNTIKCDLIDSLNEERINNIKQNIEYQFQFNKELNQKYTNLFVQNQSENLQNL